MISGLYDLSFLLPRITSTMTFRVLPIVMLFRLALKIQSAFISISMGDTGRRRGQVETGKREDWYG